MADSETPISPSQRSFIRSLEPWIGYFRNGVTAEEVSEDFRIGYGFMPAAEFAKFMRTKLAQPGFAEKWLPGGEPISLGYYDGPDAVAVDTKNSPFKERTSFGT